MLAYAGQLQDTAVGALLAWRMEYGAIYLHDIVPLQWRPPWLCSSSPTWAMVLICVEVDMCTDVLSVSISVINKCTATYTMYITAGMNLLCNVCMIYIPIHTHATPTCTWSPLNIILCSSLSSLFSTVVKLSCYMAPSYEGVGRAIDVIVYVLLSLLLLIITTVIIYSPTHTVWYIGTVPQTTSGDRW